MDIVCRLKRDGYGYIVSNKVDIASNKVDIVGQESGVVWTESCFCCGATGLFSKDMEPFVCWEESCVVYPDKSCPIWMGHVPFFWVMSHMNESCTICVSHHPNHSYGTWLIHMGHDSFIWDMTYSYGIWLIHMGHDWFIWDMTHSGRCFGIHSLPNSLATLYFINRAMHLIKRAPDLIQRALCFIKRAPYLIRKSSYLMKRSLCFIKTAPYFIKLSPYLIKRAPCFIKRGL